MFSFHHFAILASGGAIGTSLRYLIFVLIEKKTGHGFPWATLIVNLAGSFAIGFFWALFEKTAVSPATRMFIFIGILGSFTTFSTFAFDNMNLFNQQGILPMLINMLVNNMGGILLCVIGYQLVKNLY